MKHSARALPAVLLVVGVMVGYVMGPGAVTAQTGTQDVRVMDRNSSTRVEVSGSNRMHVDTEGTLTSIGGTNHLNVFGFTYAEPSGEIVLVSATNADTARAGSGDVVGINVNVSVNGNPAPVTVTLRKGTTIGSGQIVWQGTIPAGPGNLRGEFGGQSIILTNGFNVDVSPPSGSAVEMTYQVYGFGFGVECCRLAAPNRFPR